MTRSYPLDRAIAMVFGRSRYSCSVSLIIWENTPFSSKSLDCRKFPVHIHQNVKSGFRGRGIGKKLLTALLEEVSKAKLSGIKFRALRLEPCFPFFEKYGFNQFDCRRVKSWEAWLGKAPLYFMEYGRIL